MAEVKEGDIVLNYANGALRYVSKVVASAVVAPKPRSMAKTNWEEEGRLVEVQYHELNPPVQLRDFSRKVLSLDISQGPLDSNGNVKQGYLFRFNIKALQIIKVIQPGTKWPEFANEIYCEEEVAGEKGEINLSADELFAAIQPSKFNHKNCQ